MIQKDEKQKDRIADSIIYADTFRDWSEKMLFDDRGVEDVLVNAYEVKQVYDAYGDELWDVIFAASEGEETVLECLERLAGFPIENEEDLMIQFMEQAWLQYREKENE